MIARLKLLWRAWRHRGRFESELADELAFHEAARRDDLMAQGLSPRDAARQSRIELGMRELHRDDCRRARGLDWLDTAARDLRYAFRGLRRNPGYSLTAVWVLGAAIAANGVLFALYNAYALQMPPLARAERWVSLQGVAAQDGRGIDGWSPADADELLRDPPAPFEGLYWLRDIRLPVVANVSRPAYGEAVSTNYFDLLGVQPRNGRGFHEGETGSVVLSHVGWRVLLDAAPDAVGRQVEMAGRRFTVIGVAPPGFTGVTVSSALYWIAKDDFHALRPADFGDTPFIDVGGFLREDATPEQAAASLAAFATGRNAQRADDWRLSAARVLPRRGYLRPGDIEELKSIAAPIGIAFAALLLVAAANLASLVLARFAARRKELAVRAAVGAPRRRLLWQLFTECGLLAVAAALLGFALAALLADPLHQAMIGALGELSIEMREVQVDARVFGYGLALALLAALTFGGVPAWLATAPWKRGGAADVDVASMQRAAQSRLRSALMVTQLGASVVLLVLASLIAANARVAESQALGYDPQRLVALRIPPDARMREALLQLPQVQGVAAVSRFPLMMSGGAVDARVGERSLPLNLRRVESTYFDVMDLPLLQGRALRRGDEGARVVAISRRTAERLWPGRNAIGERIELPSQEALEEGEAGRYEVVAVVEDAVTGLFIGGVDGSAVYLPEPAGAPAHRAWLVRVPDSTRATLDALLRTCVAIAPQDDCDLMPLRTALRFQHTPFLVAATVATALGWTALAISCVGLYGLVSYLVQSRRRELGVRLALGARSAQVIRHVLSHAARQIALGLAVGWPLAFGISRLAASVSDQLHTFDLGSFVGWPLLLALLALGAAWIPARRTATIAPTEALREE